MASTLSTMYHAVFHVIYINEFIPHNNPMRRVLLSFPFLLMKMLSHRKLIPSHTANKRQIQTQATGSKITLTSHPGVTTAVITIVSHRINYGIY